MANHRQGQRSRDQVIRYRIGPANTLQDLHRMRFLRMRVIVHTVCRPIRGGASDSSDAQEFILNSFKSNILKEAHAFFLASYLAPSLPLFSFSSVSTHTEREKKV
jgi:hypothetical protein